MHRNARLTMWGRQELVRRICTLLDERRPLNAGSYADLVVPGETGAVVAAGDGAALTAAIGLYLDDPERLRRHGEAGLARARSIYPLDREAEALAAVYEDLWART